MLKFRSLPGSFKLLRPTPETPEPEIVEEATERPPTALTPAPPMPIFWPVAAFMITLLLADGGRLPKECLEWHELNKIVYLPLNGFPTPGFLFIIFLKCISRLLFSLNMFLFESSSLFFQI